MKKTMAKKVKLHVKTGDTVKIISGAHRGKQGKIIKVFVAEQRAIVEGINMVKRHLKPTAQKPQGSIIEKEAPIHISNLMLIDPATGQPTRIGRKLVDGKLQRYSKKTGEVIKNG
ncbi:MAG: 50S ribosomal protein L24 [Cytophagaceae bacterium]|nr:50S ribosomal protein L24 [Cytophagaceae bacterium]MDW8456721.1 50S ribosomal protein L24 [Cytophagaceae bacterium]